MIAHELERLILDFVRSWHPDDTLPESFSSSDNITEVVTLNSLEWMILVTQIEEHFGIVFDDQALKSRIFIDIVDSISHMISTSC